jgi:hypothetical protein
MPGPTGALMITEPDVLDDSCTKGNYTSMFKMTMMRISLFGQLGL